MFFLKTLFSGMTLTFAVLLGPEWYSCWKIHSWCGSPLVHGQCSPSWDKSGSHPPPLPRLLPDGHWGLFWVELTRQRGEAGQLGQGWTVCTWYLGGKIIISYVWRSYLFSHIWGVPSCELLHKGETASLMLQCRFLLSYTELPAGYWSKLELVFWYSKETRLQPFCMCTFRPLTSWEAERICLCRYDVLMTFKHNTRHQCN